MKRLVQLVLAAALVALACAPVAMAQQAATPTAVAAPAAPAAASIPAARAADVASIDAIVAAVYDVISGPAGAPRDWDRMRSLFAPEARMGSVGMRPDGSYPLRTMTPEDYIVRNTKAFATSGFFETELARTTEVFGQVAHVFSTYEARHAPTDAKPFMRGVNSIQLVHDGKRWYVLSLIWRAEDAKLQLPERYLRNG
ncbi:hypothetical protein [Massilia yuzhufengensis]|uniref:Nuclear transport factor 2 family protein n=1 Tax=Massilia yuzhufengensis TaxID=1164594 RepID=A0A1I1Q750_9BURK|nr:hypothetical protein [Massilia yuzhufengensis]SFD17827.1 hypothetical protein SAMN05216204_11856 [Massilia yuzhufengensis]